MSVADRFTLLLRDLLDSAMQSAHPIRTPEEGHLEVLRIKLGAAARAHGHHDLAQRISLVRGAPLSDLQEYASAIPELSDRMRGELGLCLHRGAA
jgi:hypothetical protein